MKKRTLKRVLSIALTLAMIFSVAVLHASGAEEKDVFEGPLDAGMDDGMSQADFSGRLGEWSKVSHNSAAHSNITLRITTDGEILYTIVEGENRDTRNVYFISIGNEGGFTRHGRPNIQYVVANGYLYRTTENRDSTTPEFVREAQRLGRIGMDYWKDWTGMQLRLEQIGNPDPAEIRISYRGFGSEFVSTEVVNIPAGTGTLLELRKCL